MITVLALAGFRGVHSAKPPIEIFVDMVRNPRYDPQHESDFYADTRAARAPVKGTVPLGYTVPGAFLSTGANNNKLDQHPGEQMAIDFDKPGRLNDRQVVWNDHLAPPAGSNFLSVQEAVAQYTKLSLPSAPDQSHMGAAMTVNHALA